MNQEKCTIYLLTNVANGKIYIGQTWEHPVEKRMGNGNQYSNSPYLYAAIKKYGIENFRYAVLAECDSQEQADQSEIENIIAYNSRDPKIGYNLKEGGSAGKHAEETKLKIAESMRNKIWSPEALENRKKAGRLWKGKIRGPHTEEWKENNSKFMIERHKSEGHPFEGQNHTEEAKTKMSEANKGQKHSLESIARGAEKRKMPIEKEQGIVKAYQEGVEISKIISIFATGASSIYRVLKRNNIEIVRPKDTWTGKKHSEETKKKMSEARSEFWSKKK